jgi:hypothetical protein
VTLDRDPARLARAVAFSAAGPAPLGDFSLYMGAYWPKVAVTDGSWTPPAVQLNPADGSRALQ